MGTVDARSGARRLPRAAELASFRALVPPPGTRTLDVGCGEGRAGRLLSAESHRVSGIDSSPTLVEMAREAGGYQQLVCGDAAQLPWEVRAFDLALAYMSLHDMEDLAGAVGEIARVLKPGGRLCLAIVHPLNRPPEALGDYFSERRFADEVERHGVRMTFESIDRPLEAYPLALAAAGFLIEELREPSPTAAALAAAPQLAKAANLTSFTCGASSRPSEPSPTSLSSEVPGSKPREVELC